MAELDPLTVLSFTQASDPLNETLHWLRDEVAEGRLDEDGVDHAASEINLQDQVDRQLGAASFLVDSIVGAPDFGPDEFGQILELVGHQVRTASNLGLAAQGAIAIDIEPTPWPVIGEEIVLVPDHLREDIVDLRLEALVGQPEMHPPEWRWTNDDELERFRARLITQEPDERAQLRSLSAAVHTPGGAFEFIESAGDRVGSQFVSFVCEPVISEIAALPLASVTAAVEDFVGSSDAFIRRGLVRQAIGMIVSRALGWLRDAIGRIEGALFDMLDQILNAIVNFVGDVAEFFLGSEDARTSIDPDSGDADVGAIWKGYDKHACRLDRIVGGGSFVLGILWMNPMAGISLGLVGAVVAVWLGSDHLGVGGVFGGQPNLVADDLFFRYGTEEG